MANNFLCLFSIERIFPWVIYKYRLLCNSIIKVSYKNKHVTLYFDFTGNPGVLVVCGYAVRCLHAVHDSRQSIMKIIKQNWNQFLLILKANVVKATAQKHQISTFYLQLQRIDASHHIYVSQWPVICLEFADKILIFAVLERWLLQLRETDSSFVL